MKALTRRALIGGVAMLPLPSFAQTPAPPEALLYYLVMRRARRSEVRFGCASGCDNMKLRGPATGRLMSAITIC